MATTQRKIGQNKAKAGKPARLWLEKKILSLNGWHKGKRFNAVWLDNALEYRADETGSRVVAGSDDRPVIDTCTDDLLSTLGVSVGDKVTVSATPSRIRITAA